MAWITPKTDWKIQPRDTSGRYNGDFFSVLDYDRIKGNLEYLATLIGIYFRIVAIVPMETIVANGRAYFDQIDNLERNIDLLNAALPTPLSINPTKHWVGNGPSPTVEDMNRIESYCVQLMNAINTQSTFVWKLPFHMAGRRF